MKPQQAVDTKELQHQIGQLQKNLAFVGQGTNAESSDLFKIIHHPGWTSVIDVALAKQIVDTMNQQALAMKGMRDALEAQVKAAATKA